jgi:hypothetical protein
MRSVFASLVLVSWEIAIYLIPTKIEGLRTRDFSWARIAPGSDPVCDKFTQQSDLGQIGIVRILMMQCISPTA